MVLLRTSVYIFITVFFGYLIALLTLVWVLICIITYTMFNPIIKAVRAYKEKGVINTIKQLYMVEDFTMDYDWLLILILKVGDLKFGVYKGCDAFGNKYYEVWHISFFFSFLALNRTWISHMVNIDGLNMPIFIILMLLWFNLSEWELYISNKNFD